MKKCLLLTLMTLMVATMIAKNVDQNQAKRIVQTFVTQRDRNMSQQNACVQSDCDTLYWTDVVLAEPSGYFVDSVGIVHISSAEGLAWLAKSAEYTLSLSPFNWGYLDQDVSIENDIDLGDYLWKPIGYWRGNWNGNGFAISDMHAVGSGFFAEFSGDTIQNLGFIDPFIDSDIGGGTIIGLGQGRVSIINCYSMNFYIHGASDWVGGLVGETGVGTFINCFAIGRICLNGNVIGVGGIVGYGPYKMFNCYTSIRSIECNNYPYKGLLSAYKEVAHYSNCFADMDYVENSWSLTNTGYFFGYTENLTCHNVAAFTKSAGSSAVLVPDVALDYSYDTIVDLLYALNEGVVMQNSTLLRTWVLDSITNLPKHGDFFGVVCPNVSNISASTITNENVVVELMWHENGTAEGWEIKCLPHDVDDDDSAIYFTSYDTVFYISGLSLGKEYDFYVRPICDDNNPIIWGEPLWFLVDKEYWVDVVTSCPSGYITDADGNVKISSPEGLAWLSVCSNGLNGQSETNYAGVTVEILKDLDMGQYKWTPIGHHYDEAYNNEKVFRGTFHGNGYTISNIYCCEKVDSHLGQNPATYLGLIGQASTAVIKDVVLVNGCVKGYNKLGMLFGNAINSEISNCHSYNCMVEGGFYVGGLGGGMLEYSSYGQLNDEWFSRAINCSSSGVVRGDKQTGGLFGSCSSQINGSCSPIVNNCYSTCDIQSKNMYSSVEKGGLIGQYSGELQNCYNAGNIESVEYGWLPGASFGSLVRNCNLQFCYLKHSNYNMIRAFGVGGTYIIADTTSFDDSHTMFNPITIGDYVYTDLLPALNAWVDANNSEGSYLHWIADTAMVNGGFPIHETISNDYHSIVASVNPEGSGSITGSGLYLHGETVTLSVTPEQHYCFVNWMENDSVASRESTFTFTATDDRVFVANMSYNSVDEYDADCLTVYPNPAMDRIWVESTNKHNKIDIYSIIGLKVYDSYDYAKKTEINIENLSAGIYVIRVVSDGVVEMRRFVKQ